MMKKCKGKYGEIHEYSEDKIRCPECNRIWFREYRKKKGDLLRSRRMKYYYENHEENKIKQKKYANKRKSKKREYDIIYRKQNQEKIKRVREKYKKENPEKVRMAIKNHYENNKEMYYEYSAHRRASKRKATPDWSERDKIKLLYQKVKWLESLTGMKYHVDHVVPLNHPDVCGLHVWSNLQILEASENLIKNNSF